MRIINKDSDADGHSAFVYNSDDGVQWIALASKPMDPNETWDYDPPSNRTGLYTLLIHAAKGGAGGIRGSGTGPSSATFTFDGKTLTVA